ncbi:hypothetical protein NL676_037314 [Syzygium grande]|nr:hypothetical protein NL676_037314 [Syzygium grande]
MEYTLRRKQKARVQSGDPCAGSGLWPPGTWHQATATRVWAAQIQLWVVVSQVQESAYQLSAPGSRGRASTSRARAPKSKL